jgi:hypothetical protein
MTAYLVALEKTGETTTIWGVFTDSERADAYMKAIGRKPGSYDTEPCYFDKEEPDPDCMWWAVRHNLTGLWIEKPRRIDETPIPPQPVTARAFEFELLVGRGAPFEARKGRRVTPDELR